MSDPINPNVAKKIISNVPVAVPVETVAEAHPPLQAFSANATAAVSGTNTSNGNAVYGKSASGDGVHGESNGTNVSGVAGIHTAGGNGVYGKSSGNAGNFDGNVQVNGNLNVTGDIYLPGADCAEQFDFVGSTPIERGTLVVIDGSGGLRESRDAYDRKVAGVVAGAGNYRPGIVLDKNTTGAERIVVSLMGKVYCKVDAEYGAIEVGDLLTSSPTAGYAMKASDRDRAFGTVVGKALQPLECGQGLIPILIALQ